MDHTIYLINDKKIIDPDHPYKNLPLIFQYK